MSSDGKDTHPEAAAELSLPPNDATNCAGPAAPTTTTIEADNIRDDSSTVKTDNLTKSATASSHCDCCCGWWKFQGVAKAKGFSYATIGNGSILISNVFLSSSIIFLASQEAGCIDETTGRLTECTTRVYGFLPSSLVNSIYGIASLIAAFGMPLFGAIIDFTSHRRSVGRWLAFGLWLIQTIQIGTVSQTWFAMAVLQAVAGVLFEFHFLLAVSYLPDILRYEVSYETMNRFNRTFFGLQFGSQTFYLLVVIVVSTWIMGGWGSVRTAQLGQGLSSATLLFVLPLAWTWSPAMPAKHKLPEGRSLMWEGFRQNYRTIASIAKNHRPLKLFLITVALAEGGTTPLIPTMITIMSQVYKYNSSNVGIGFLVALVSTLPGVLVGAIFSRRYNPQISQRTNLGVLTVGTIVAAFVIEKNCRDKFFQVTDGEISYAGYVFSGMWGFLVGMYYATQQLFFTACLPPKQEAELSGIYVYCTIILTWVPTVAGSIMLNSGAGPQWLLLPLVIFQALALWPP
ncbi:vacuole effluxer Atg22 like protein [Nitzschia inconspicua]|uniref:Vacuole effluxer Atg22 like protein n=1 Tax=Nitzschia inconspicua TaxID=303405 RepID=A0A9K3M2E1_9STRA|nr:vacuole effluxer Atg22 like protein [Nitzschia inconspicua]